MKDWRQQFKKLEEENEFYGLPYDENTSSLINKFISLILEEQRKEVLKEIRNYIKENNQDKALVADEIYAKLSVMFDNKTGGKDDREKW